MSFTQSILCVLSLCAPTVRFAVIYTRHSFIQLVHTAGALLWALVFYGRFYYVLLFDSLSCSICVFCSLYCSIHP
uniref:Putative secreted peptide n=1 Tax=Anopheles braziliensis TaxID=58242 RepID=A0A2M3ZUJ0_9DIPT